MFSTHSIIEECYIMCTHEEKLESLPKFKCCREIGANCFISIDLVFLQLTVHFINCLENNIFLLSN